LGDLLDLLAEALVQGVNHHNTSCWKQRIADKDIIEDEHIILATFTGKELEGKTFTNCTFEDCKLIDVDFEKTRFIDVTFDRCMFNP